MERSNRHGESEIRPHGRSLEWTERLRFFSHVVTKPQRTGPRQRQPLPSDGDPDLVATRQDREPFGQTTTPIVRAD
jgi:hypothetical protein